MLFAFLVLFLTLRSLALEQDGHRALVGNSNNNFFRQQSPKIMRLNWVTQKTIQLTAFSTRGMPKGGGAGRGSWCPQVAFSHACVRFPFLSAGRVIDTPTSSPFFFLASWKAVRRCACLLVYVCWLGKCVCVAEGKGNQNTCLALRRGVKRGRAD